MPKAGTDEPIRLPNAKHVIALMKEAATVKEKTSSIAGAFGERMKAAQENGHLNGKAFRFVAGLHRMEELKRNATIAHLRAYLEFAEEEWARGSHHGDLAEQAEKDAAATAEAAQVAENEKNLKGIKQLEPKEDEAPKRTSSFDDDDDDWDKAEPGEQRTAPPAPPAPAAVPSNVTKLPPASKRTKGLGPKADAPGTSAPVH